MSLFHNDSLVSSNETFTHDNRRVSKRDLVNYWRSRVQPFMHSQQIHRYSSPYIPIRILHLHDPVSIRTNFLCNIMPNTPRSCQASMEADERGKSELAHMNIGKATADRIWFDQLVTTAVEQGMLNTSNTTLRARMVNKVKHQHEVLLNRTLFDFPRACPNQRALNLLWDCSWGKEQLLLGDRANLTLHKELFKRNIENAKYCSIDPLETLKRKEWELFFKGGWRKVRTIASSEDRGSIRKSKQGTKRNRRRGRKVKRKRRRLPTRDEYV